jgi:class 3 adenylate cyclase
VKSLGISVRAGLHTGECELIGDDVGGIAVHIGARVAAMAAPGEVLVSGTVKDLVAGSGLRFTDRGTHALKGVPGEWKLYGVDASARTVLSQA